ncbi:hypothetical protein OIU79_012881 [Salix purpurea]|uniref:Uncharacterized protein n=1 Tax=Salix purpurea TaxID=77065 RepID=A0A9Q0Q477_SALPP|nr:hypothetical protein OIU79_012881 [Salix purpurea]
MSMVPPLYLLQYTIEMIHHATYVYKEVSYQLAVQCLKFLHIISCAAEGGCKETRLPLCQHRSLDSQRKAEKIAFQSSVLMVPSPAVEEAHVVSQDQHERGTSGALMPPPIEDNSDYSPCRLSLQGSLQLPTSSTMFEISAHNHVYRRRKLRGNSVTFLSAQVPGITKRSREDCLSVISSDGPSLAVEEARVLSQDQYERGTGGALPRPPLVCYGEPLHFKIRI